MFVGALVIVGWLTWGLFLMMMPLKRSKEAGTLTTVAKVFGYPWLAVMILMDAFFNLVYGTIIFMEIPHEILFTARLDRMLCCDTTWRRRVALYLCDRFLDPFDPDGRHCEAKGK
jgi:hypothetical protein